MFYATLKTIHLLSVIVWVGGMVFVQFFLRPVAATLAPPERVRLMHAVLARFFNAVLVGAGLALVSGFWMMARNTRAVAQTGVKASMPLEWIAMAVLGLVMTGIFCYIRFALYQQLAHAVMAAAWPAGGAVLARIRAWVMVNLVIGVMIVAITLLGASS
jgi:uncharacterized membrane protein